MVKIRSSSQLYIDDNLNLNSKKLTNVLDGTANTDAVTVKQLNNATSGLSSSVHVPVADLTAAVAINSAGRADRMLMHIESLGLYRFDAESVVASNNGSTATIIRPTDVATDAAAGRWIRISAPTTDHALLTNILGAGDYHLSSAEVAKLTGIESGADVTDAQNIASSIVGVSAKTALVDGDILPIIDSEASNTLKKTTWSNIKSVLKTYFDTLYEKVANKDATGGYVGLTLFRINFKNAANTFTSFFTNENTAERTYKFADRDGIIADNTDISNAKSRSNHTGTQLASTISDFNAAALLAAPAETLTTVGTLINSATAKTTPVDADMIGIADSAASNVLKKFTFGNLKTFIGAFFSGDITVTAGGVTAIGANKVTNAMHSTVATSTMKGRVTAGTGNVEDLTVAQIKTLLGLNVNNQLTRRYRIVPTGVVNNSNVTFTIADLVVSGTEEIFKNGLLMNAGAGNDYTIVYGATTTITFLEAPNNTGYSDVILVNYSIA